MKFKVTFAIQNNDTLKQTPEVEIPVNLNIDALIQEQLEESFIINDSDSIILVECEAVPENSYKINYYYNGEALENIVDATSSNEAIGIFLRDNTLLNFRNITSYYKM